MPEGFVTKSVRALVRALRLAPALLPLALTIPSAPVQADSSNLLKIEPALLNEMSAYPSERIPIIIEMAAPSPPFTSSENLSLAQQAVSILNANGQAVGALSLVQGAAGYANAAGILAMSMLPQVAVVEQDSVVRARKPSTSGPSYPPGQMTSLYPAEVNATKVWQQNGTGNGVTVAVMDSGIAPDTDLTVTSGNRILAEVSFATPYNPSQPDPGGHGSHVAGIIAGDGTKSANQYVGIAPKANLVSVQVLDANGNGRVSSVLRGLEWVLAHKNQFHIRVVNMSFGAPETTSYKFDAFATGVEIAWKYGLVVVVAAGNQGPTSGTVESAGVDPYAITVGATDDQGTADLTKSTLAWFSSYGVANDPSDAKPDVVAPGRRLVSIYVPGSTLAQDLPSHLVVANNGADYFRLTGTSMATPVVSGTVALMLERNGSLTPDQVKSILMGTTQPFGQSEPAPPAGSIGAGLINTYAAWSSGPRGSANKGQRQSDGLARTLYWLVYNQPLTWNSLTYLGTNWTGYTWLNLPWNDPTWDNIAWDNIAWDNIAWDNIAWDQTSWDNIAWDNIAWDNTEWNNIAWDNLGFD